MTTDYSGFLHTAEDGRIWWRVEDAIKLAAGYQPVCDDHNPVPVLTAPNNRVKANVRTLLGAFQDGRHPIVPRVLEREDGRFIEACGFLRWLYQYSDVTRAMPFPGELARLVREVKFPSLTVALEQRFETSFCDLPDVLRLRVEQDFLPMPWDDLSPEQRRSVAQQWDDQHDPAREDENQFWWDLGIRRRELEQQRKDWEAVATPTAQDLALKESRLAELDQELVRLEKQKSRGYCPLGKPPKSKDIVPDRHNWKMLVQAEAARRWTVLRNVGASPTKRSLKAELARWCSKEGVKTETGIVPSAEYIYRHGLRGWKPPID